MTSTTFWNYYGGDDHKYNVLVTVTDKNGQELTIIDQEAEQSTDVVINDESGLLLNIKLNDDANQDICYQSGYQ